MYFKDKKTFAGVFEQYYKVLMQIANESDIVTAADFELLPAMFVVADYAAVASHRHARMDFANEVRPVVDQLIGDATQAAFDRRIMFYGTLMANRKMPRGDWYPGEVSKAATNGVSRIVIALGDILMNPGCAEAYDGAPLIFHGEEKQKEFCTKVMKPMLEMFFEMYKDILEM